MKVLIIGMQYVPNQFTRAMDSYEGIEWEHVDSDPNGHIPRCDTAILTTCQLSHEKFYQAKQIMKNSGKPFFVTHSSFSKIKNDFEDLLRAKGVGVKIRVNGGRKVTVNGQMGQALKAAIKDVTPEQLPQQQKTPLVKDPAKVLPKLPAQLPPNGPIEIPSQRSFERAVERIFTADPVLGSQLRQFFFIGQNSNNFIELGVRVQDRHVAENIRDDKAAMQKISAHLARAWGWENVKGVNIMLAYRKSISGEALYKLGLKWQAEGLDTHGIITRLQRENYHKPSDTPWTNGDITANRSLYKRKSQERSLKHLPTEAPLPPPAKVVKPEPPVLLPPQFKKPEPAPAVSALSITTAPAKVSSPDEFKPSVQLSKEDLIAKVIALKDMDALKKIQLIEEINAGVRTVEHQVIAEKKGELLQLTAQSIFHPDDKPLLVMDRALAKDIVSCLDAIEKFAKGG